MNCPEKICVVERYTAIVLHPIGCQKWRGHTGMHYNDQVLDLLDGRVRGRLAVGWDGRDCWVHSEGLTVIDAEGRELEPQLLFKEGDP